jgi:hypothetical protein
MAPLLPRASGEAEPAERSPADHADGRHAGKRRRDLDHLAGTDGRVVLRAGGVIPVWHIYDVQIVLGEPGVHQDQPDVAAHRQHRAGHERHAERCLDGQQRAAATQPAFTRSPSGLEDLAGIDAERTPCRRQADRKRHEHRRGQRNGQQPQVESRDRETAEDGRNHRQKQVLRPQAGDDRQRAPGRAHQERLESARRKDAP